MPPLSKPCSLTALEVADIIEGFVRGTCGPYDWDDFTSLSSLTDPELESIRAKCESLPLEFPPTAHGQYCNDAGADELMAIVRRLRGAGAA